MKKSCILLFLFALAAFQSCEKHDERPKDVVLNISLASNEDYKLNLGNYGKQNSTADIAVQSAHQSISEIIPGTLTYHYLASSKTGVTDKVVISIKNSKRGDCGNGEHHDDDDDDDDATKVTINFTIN